MKRETYMRGGGDFGVGRILFFSLEASSVMDKIFLLAPGGTIIFSVEASARTSISHPVHGYTANPLDTTRP